jgi:hypothetical protein
MCDPVTAVAVGTAVVSAGGAVYQAQQQNEQIEAANEAAENRHRVEVDRAKQEARDRQNQLAHDAMVEGQRLSQERQKLAREAMVEQASLRAASAESGTGGVSKIRSFIASEIGEDLARSDIEQSQRNSQFNISQQARAIATASRTRQENAGFTLQASQRRKIGTGQMVLGALTAAAPGLGSAAGGLLTPSAPAPTGGTSQASGKATASSVSSVTSNIGLKK